ncbi:AIP3-domain-containing protein [Panus rudis PR-1116 ss-1]|nr:AIP3-domain-containing protein [Panus rudis PR-1116 ss-1]
MASTATRGSTHSSRRDHQSISSNYSVAGSSRSERSSRSNGTTPAVESTVTRLLVAIKQLLESLTMWSKQEATETHVSDVYVRLGNDFNAAVSAFAAYNIDMSELLSVPEDLRSVLESCLAEDATPENLEVYLPSVRKIITGLLQGLRTKQHIYRKIVSETKHQSSSSSATDRPESSASMPGSHRKSSRSQIESSDSLSRRSASSSRRKESVLSPRSTLSSQQNGDSERFVGGFAVGPPPASDPGEPVPYRSSTPRSQPQRLPSERNGIPPSRTPSASASLPNREQANGTPEPPPVPPQESSTSSGRPISVHAPVPSHVPRYSLSDKPVLSPPPAPTPPPAVVVNDESEETTPTSRPGTAQSLPSPTTENAPLDTQAPAIKSSLLALKDQNIERRASRRWSRYNMNKMTGGSGFDRDAARISLAAASSSLTPRELDELTEEGEEGPVTPSKRDRGRMQRHRPPSTIVEEETPPPVPPLPPHSRDVSPQKPTKEPPPSAEAAIAQAPSISTTTSAYASAASTSPSPAPPEPESDSGPKTMTVFLQVGKEVKKVQIEPGLSVSSLRMLFLDKFAYSPGKDNFPAIYIRDPSSGVQYELEDMDEVQDKCLLSLNIEPLDQIKQHIDTQISTLSQDIKDLRAMVVNSRRNSIPPPMIIGQPLSESTPAAAQRPSERTFRNVARTISRLIPSDNDKTPQKPEGGPVLPQMTGMSLQPQMTGVSVMSESSSRIVSDLKTQFDEVQNLRRDLGVMRQLYTEFMKQTKESLGTLRTQTQNVRQLASAKVGGARAYINDGKSKLDNRSQNVLTKMEELQDTVEAIKDDVLKRNVSPRPVVLKQIKSDIESVSTELQSLKEHIQTIKPMWKKTWEEELQNIVEEQQFLSHQEEFLSDLLEDHKAVVEVYGHVEKVISLRSSTPGKGLRTGRSFRPPPPDEGHQGLSTVMLEIKGAAIDPERRLKAIAANEKNREKELAARSDEFQAELSGFVEGNKLKKTGGAEEAERVRQKRNENTLKAMFSSGGADSSVDGGLAGQSPSQEEGS